jgi:hypothetical protein
MLTRAAVGAPIRDLRERYHSSSRGMAVALSSVIGVAAVAALYLYVASFRFTLIDDAYIQLQYARNLAEHQTWGFLPGRIANTATSPLNVLVMAAVGLVLPSMQEVALWLTALELAITLLVLVRISRRLFDGQRYFGILAFVGLALNPLLLSSIGLEGTLYTLLLVLCLDLFLARQWTALAVALGLLTLTRPDGALFFLVVFVLAPLTWRQRGVVTLLYSLVLLPWHLYAWLRLGSLVPDTLFIKLEQTGWGPTVFSDGPELYLKRFPTETRLSVLLPPLALLLLWRCPPAARRIVAVLGSYGVLHYLAYAAMAVPPYHWYYLNQLVPAVLLGSLGLAALISTWRRDRLPAQLVALAGLALPVIGLLILFAERGYPLREAPIHTNWATPSEYRAVGLEVRELVEPGAVVEVHGEIGTLAYDSQRLLVDDFSDMNRTAGAIFYNDYRDTPVVRDLISWNFTHRRILSPLPPATYVIEFGIPGDGRADDPGVIKVWQISTLWTGEKTIYLRRVG